MRWILVGLGKKVQHKEIKNMRTKTFFSALIVALLFSSCGGNRNERNRTSESIVENNDTVAVTQLPTPMQLEPLQDEVLRLRNRNPFTEITHLTGRHIYVEELIFRPSEVEMVIQDNFLVMKSRTPEEIFAIVSLPDFEPIKTFGRFGQGPNDFMFPHLFRNTNPNILASILETTNGVIHNILLDGSLQLCEIRLPRPQSGGFDIGIRAKPALMTDSLFFFAAISPTGQSAFTIDRTDSLRAMNELRNLAFDPGRRGWANYIGYLAVNVELNRMVYAYKYFKKVKFFDLENNTTRVLNFEREEFDERTLRRADGLDANVTHYWGISAGERYVFLLYSGRTPVQVMNDNRRGNYFIYVEQFDWNGNPIAKFRLDQWGFFAFDEKNNQIILVSTNDDSSFFVYEL